MNVLTEALKQSLDDHILDRWAGGAAREEKAPIRRCELCEKPLYDGDKVLINPRYKVIDVCLCEDCYAKMTKEEFVSWLGIGVKELFEED
jgi:hypothetical protein